MVQNRLALTVLTLLLFPAITLTQSERPGPTPPRTFPQFNGTWVLDEAASSGRLTITPRIPRQLTISTSADAVTLSQVLRLNPSDDPARDRPAPVE